MIAKYSEGKIRQPTTSSKSISPASLPQLTTCPWHNLLLYMKSKFVPLALGLVIAILLSLLPIYPLWVEGHQITQSGESLYHELQFVSMRGYYEYAQYARTAWADATKVVYVV